MIKISGKIKRLLNSLNNRTTYGYWVVLKENDLIRPYLLRWHDQEGHLHITIPEDLQGYSEIYGGLSMTEMYHYMYGIYSHKDITKIINKLGHENNTNPAHTKWR